MFKLTYTELKKFDFDLLISFTEKANTLMWYYESGMLAQIIRCETQVIYNVPLIYLEFDCTAYADYNKQYERMIYYTNDMSQQQTATDMGLQKTRDYAYFASNTDFNEWFTILNGKFWEEYKEIQREEPYLYWLENELYKARNH
jgi:hypothetical protein